MGFPRPEHWSGLPFPPPEDLSDPGIEPGSPAWQVDSLPLSHLGRYLSSFFLKKKPLIYSFIFIYLALLGLSCGMWDLWLIHVGSRSLARDGTQAPCIQHTES